MPSCTELADWDDDLVALENDVLALTNDLRTNARNCGSQNFSVAPELDADALLQCSARSHALDMATRDYFSHDTPEGVDFAARIEAAGYSFSAAGENIAWGQSTASEVVTDWVFSPGHCSNMMSNDYRDIGIGAARASDGSLYWVQNFASP